MCVCVCVCVCVSYQKVIVMSESRIVQAPEELSNYDIKSLMICPF